MASPNYPQPDPRFRLTRADEEDLYTPSKAKIKHLDSLLHTYGENHSLYEHAEIWSRMLSHIAALEAENERMREALGVAQERLARFRDETWNTLERRSLLVWVEVDGVEKLLAAALATESEGT